MEVEDQKELLVRIDENVKSILERLKSVETDLSILKTDNATNKTRITTNESEIEKLRGESTKWNFINSVGAVIAGIIGFTIH